MKLRNKNTGEVGILIVDGAYKFVTNFAVEDNKGDRLNEYDSLAELNEDWQDYEEPKECFIVDIFGKVGCWTLDDEKVENMKQIGNYFETPEQAEKAVEKLKAWKRLKDKGFRFTGIGQTVYDIDCAEFDIGSEYLRERDLRGSELNKDLDLLFGGEE